MTSDDARVRIGRRVLAFDSLDSTNTYALGLADNPTNDGVVVLAAQQTAGRGQHGRVWQAPAGSSVLTSVLIFPPPPLQRPSVLTAWAAVSVCEMIFELTGLQAKIKWPNDVLIQGKKVCGILIEQRTVARWEGEAPAEPQAADGSAGGSPSPPRNWQLATVAGIGLNVNQSAADFAAAGLSHAASLAMFDGHMRATPDVAQLLIRRLDEAYGSLLQGDWATLEACWKWRVGLLGKQVVAECHQGTYAGRLRELSFDGLELELGSSTVRLSPEAVRHLEARE